MRTIFRGSLALACGVALAASALCAGAQAAPKLPLGHAGRWITDARGRVMLIHGINMVYKLAPFYPGAVGFGNDDAAFLHRIGFNAVRVGVLWEGLEPHPGMYDDSYLNHIAATVRVLARHGIVSLLDFHQDQYNERFEGEGFPTWSVQDDGLPAEPKLGFGADYPGMPALSHAFDHFWANSPGPGGIGLQDRYGAAWADVARRFRSDRSVLGYELMNEPWPGTVWPTCAQPAGCRAFDRGPLTAFYLRVRGALRAVDRRSLLWYEPNVLFNNGASTHAGPLHDARAGFAFHDYCLTEPGSGAQGCQRFDGLVFSNAVAHARATGEALLETEFGATNDIPYLTDEVQLADRYMTPWLEWAYCGCKDPTTSGPGDKQAIVRDPAKPPRGSNLVLPTLRALVEPYPQLISGTPRSWRFDPATETFHFTYTVARASGRGRFKRGSVTEIATPRLVYARPYAARVHGARIVSERGASLLRLAACPRARTITVTVTRSGRSRSGCGRRVRKH